MAKLVSTLRPIPADPKNDSEETVASPAVNLFGLILTVILILGAILCAVSAYSLTGTSGVA